VITACVAVSFGACRSQRIDVKPARAATPTVAKEATVVPVVSTRKTTGEATLLLMADIRGVLRPCGCTVDLQKGGFERLKPHLDAERAAFPGAHLLHAGPLFYEGPEVEAEKRAQRARQVEVAADLIRRAGIDTVALTTVDLAASHGKLHGLLEVAKVGATVANVTVPEGHSYPRFLVRRIGGLDVGIFALASDAHAEQLGDAASVTSPRDAAAKVVAEMAPKADVIVLLSALGLRQTKRLVRKVPGIDFAIVGGLGEHPIVSDEAELVGETRVMQFHREGRFVGRLTVRQVDGQRAFVDMSSPSDAELKVLDVRIAALEASLTRWKGEGVVSTDRAVRSARHHVESLTAERTRLKALKDTDGDRAAGGKSTYSYRVTPLNWDLPQDPELLSLMDAFDEELKVINLANAGALPEAKPGQAVYVGVDECLSCHDDVQAFWDNDQHHHAWETLVRLKKTFDVECVSCHVTGYGKPGGSILGKTEGREDVQCESCHGPGSIHAESEDAADIIAKPPEATCVTCHNAHHSPKFNFQRWRKRIKVPGHGRPLK
jgi:hypothetical protein